MEITKSTLDLVLSRLEGQVLLFVGHVEGSAFVKRGVRNQVIENIEIIDLMRAAEQHKVLLIPVGCNTSDAGAPIGSTRNIVTDEIVSLVSSLRKKGQYVSDLFRALEQVGDIQINFDWTGKAIEAIILHHGTREAKIQFKYHPVPAPQSTSPSSSSDDDDSGKLLIEFRLNEAAELAATLRDRYPGVLGAIQLFRVDHPFYSWLIVLFSPLVAAGVTQVAAEIRRSRTLEAIALCCCALSGLWFFGTVLYITNGMILLFAFVTIPISLFGWLVDTGVKKITGQG
jgi:hypothetical protein